MKPEPLTAPEEIRKRRRGKIVTNPKLVALQKIISAVEELENDKDREWVLRNAMSMLDFPIVDGVKP